MRNATNFDLRNSACDSISPSLNSPYHRLVLDPTDPRRLAETRQSIKAMRLVRRGVKLLHKEMEEHVERVKVLFPA